MGRLGQELFDRIKFATWLLLFLAPVEVAAWRQQVLAELNKPARTEPTFAPWIYIDHDDPDDGVAAVTEDGTDLAADPFADASGD